MALDYSKLSDKELEAIANNDYSRLSDDVLKKLAEETSTVVESQPYVSQAEADRNELLGAAALAAGAGAAGYGAYKFSPIIQTVKKAADVARNIKNVAQGGPVPPAGVPGSPTNPIGGSAPTRVPVTAPNAPVAPSPILDASGRPITPPLQPIAPQPMPQATAQPDSLTNRVRAAAASKIQNLPGAGMMGSAGRMVGRVLPGAGTVLNAADAYSRAQQGDYLGAGLAGIGAAASPFPILGTAVGMGTGALNAYRDYLKQEEEKKRMQQ